MFQQRLKDLRLKKGLTQRQAAQELGLKENTYRHYENNEREPSSETLIAMSQYFGVTVDYLVGLSDAPEKYYTVVQSVIKSSNPDYDLLKDELMNLEKDELIELRNYIRYLIFKRNEKKQE